MKTEGREKGDKGAKYLLRCWCMKIGKESVERQEKWREWYYMGRGESKVKQEGEEGKNGELSY